MPSIGSIWLDMKRVLRTARQIINAELEPLNLSSAEGDILFHILAGDSKFTQENLAESLDIGKAAISRAVNSLERKGYLARVRLSEDRRAYIVSPTDKAFSAGKEIKRIYNSLYMNAKKDITDEELESIESMLSRVSINLQTLENENVE